MYVCTHLTRCRFVWGCSMLLHSMHRYKAGCMPLCLTATLLICLSMNKRFVEVPLMAKHITYICISAYKFTVLTCSYFKFVDLEALAMRVI